MNSFGIFLFVLLDLAGLVAAVDNAIFRCATLKVVLAAELESVPCGAESPRLVDELQRFLLLSEETVSSLAKLRLVAASNLRPLHQQLKVNLDHLKEAGAAALLSQYRAVSDAAKHWFEGSQHLLSMASGLADAVLQEVAQGLEEIEAERERSEALLRGRAVVGSGITRYWAASI